MVNLVPSSLTVARRVLLVVMDGVGVSTSTFGNAVARAHTPGLKYLSQFGAYTTLAAHGTAVGLPSDNDIGNSEVGHNALGAGRIFDQGAKLVQNAINSGAMFRGQTWRKLIENTVANRSTLHFLGLVSDGNVHSHEEHLYSMMRQAKREGVGRMRIHVLFDGRDVGQKTAEIYAEHLQNVIQELNGPTCDVRVASGGGRMTVTMDRYEADWDMVHQGWQAHVEGEGRLYASLTEVLRDFRSQPDMTDQYFPAFVIADQGKPVGRIEDGDGVVFFNFRGDRAIEISRAFTEVDFRAFSRPRFPKVFFAGMTQYDGDLHIPSQFLVSPPLIDDTMGEHLAHLGLRQFACSETQKYGHVTFFWNGNRSDYFDKAREEYVEIPSDNIAFDLKPWMKAHEICEATIDHMARSTFDFGRINFANGDMVGHTGNFDAAVVAVETVDLMLERLILAAKKHNVTLLVTADHGNADEMFDAKAKDFPDWENLPFDRRPRPKTSHTLNLVPFYVFDPKAAPGSIKLSTAVSTKRSLGNVANTAMDLMGLKLKENYLPSLLRVE